MPFLSRSRRRQSKLQESRAPEDSDLKQQRLAATTVIGTPKRFIGTFAVTGAILASVGGAYVSRGRSSVVYREQYDGPGTPPERSGCKIRRADAGVECNVTVRVKEKMRPPVHVFYEIEGFHQNHRRYVQSLEWDQLHNRVALNERPLREGDCGLLYENKSFLLNPCGLVPNTLFNDVVSLAAPASLEMKEDDIAWRSDVKDVLKQPDDFEWRRSTTLDIDDACFEDSSYLSETFCQRSTCAEYGISNSAMNDGAVGRVGTCDGDCAACLGYVCRGSYFDEHKCEPGEKVVFHYHRVDKYAYLYRTFPQVVSPIVGVNAEHFVVWMRPAGLPHFRKLYGRLSKTLDDDLDLVFTVQNNWDVSSFGGKKFLVVATTDAGFESTFLGLAYITVGAICLGLAAFFLAFNLFRPRVMGDPKYIPW
mmetsp:Transcript_22998/g.72104  ORF Transcript_22998/g.72104 Transcript_22998/m.72104 type:complete len:421 (-) Transcript_22998:317-1579(-)